MKIRTLGSLPFIIAAAIASLTQITFAQTWQTIVDFRYYGHPTSLNSMAKDPFGNLYATGSGSETNLISSSRALITKSSDGGVTWSVSDSFALSPQPYAPEYRAITSDSMGNLYALADEVVPDYDGIVRRSQDSGVTWSTVLDLPTVLRGIATDAAGNVYVVCPPWTILKSADAGNSWSIVDAFNPGRSPGGSGVLCHPTLGIFVVGGADAAITVKKKTTYQPTSYVRRSLDGGATWTTVDAYPSTGMAGHMAADAAGNLYLTGDRDSHWIVRNSANGGTAWTTVDEFFPQIGSTNYSASPSSIAADAYGNVFVGGRIATSSGPGYWAVRKLPAGSGTWQTVDVFQYAPGRGSAAKAVVADDFGNVFVGGIGLDLNGANGSSHWLVRRLVP